MRVETDVFLTRLEKLFESAKEKNSVYITTKPCGEKEGTQSSVLFRVSDGRSVGRTRFSTIVAPSQILAFQESYLTMLRSNLAGMLKKRDKAKERRVDKLLVASRKKIEENGGKVKIGGSKRGAGRRKRMRAVKRAQKVRAARANAQQNATSTST
ncbi:signal recognition particle srp9 srp14 subunit [Malassezia pachydermatis]|uniref:Signal recognition particle subunit SRP14 n=1 Tax=Malassezia pachydermatis TaxID=77020 RepID=A0A0M8MIF6_9BASI|nr:signal recognition particle srp9 srp14 subunit [Malassezia pachydermatis]KOS13106.1 signal recognition particle srp9 srp14 subunit [Malassezia pachydermatis]